MQLYWGCRKPADLYMAALPEQWAREVPGFSYVPVLSEVSAQDGWQGRTGLVHQAVMADHPDLSGHEVYACGVPVMVDAAQRDFLAQCGLPEDAFFADSFLDESSKAAASV
jgi:CDP-4-dehydro-6-deoxyglucose reductase